MKKILLFFVVLTAGTTYAQEKVYSKTNYSPTYEEIIAFYQKLDKQYTQATFKPFGKTDIGLPVHVLSIKNESKNKKARILINNGIHPGEPDGINACMHLADEILGNWEKHKSMFDSIDLHIIAVYNVDGCLRRGNNSRANQDGPAEYGFRGNYQNLDLNRDFIKMDSKNATTFAKIFHTIDPNILIDTHVSNGADYQYTFTYFFTNACKLPPNLSKICKKIDQGFQQKMKAAKIDVAPYINHHDETPMSAIAAFDDSPRYCTGYAALFNCIGMTTETHMLKPFDDRVKTTYEALKAMLKLSAANQNELNLYKNENSPGREVCIGYALDTVHFENIPFKGFKPGYRTSDVTGQQQLYYDRTKPYTGELKYYNTYLPKTVVQAPKAYIVLQAYEGVIERLRANEIQIKRLKNDTVVKVECYLAKKAGVGNSPYEGHYYHSDVEVEKITLTKKFYKGDWVIPCNDVQKRFVTAVLEPEAVDSYFRWNFFDACLQQKEWFSDYVFDPKAAELLKKDPALKEKFEAKKKAEPEFAANKWDQLVFIYRNSPYYEGTAWEIPVYRIF